MVSVLASLISRGQGSRMMGFSCLVKMKRNIVENRTTTMDNEMEMSRVPWADANTAKIGRRRASHGFEPCKKYRQQPIFRTIMMLLMAKVVVVCCRKGYEKGALTIFLCDGNLIQWG